MLKGLGNKSKMKNDSLRIHQNEDGSFSVEWDKEDPDWKWLNGLTSKEIEVIIKEAVRYDQQGK
tara:strand:+ start:409 stop:600 length:192 start_codon:yes stop_codon:yes gene_type:complete